MPSSRRGAVGTTVGVLVLGLAGVGVAVATNRAEWAQPTAVATSSSTPPTGGPTRAAPTPAPPWTSPPPPGAPTTAAPTTPPAPTRTAPPTQAGVPAGLAGQDV